MLYIKQYLRYIHNINAPYGGAAAVAAAAMPQPARTKAGPTKRQQHSSTTKEQLLWGGASLRSPMRLTGCCCRATRTPHLLSP